MEFRASSHQERLWFVDKFEFDRAAKPAANFHNVPLFVFVRGRLEIERLNQSLQAVSNLHSIFRTRIVMVEDQLMQSIADEERHIPFETLDWAGNESQTMQNIDLAVSEFCGAEFDLAGNEVGRARLVRLAPQSFMFILCFHHASVDHASLAIIWSDVMTHYSGVGSLEATAPLQYSDFAQWQLALPEENLEHDLLYWKKKVGKKLIALNLPTDFPRPAVLSYKHACESLEVPRSLLDEIESYTSSFSVGAEAFWLSAFAGLLAVYSRQQELVIGKAYSNRDRPETKAIVGPIENLSFLKFEISEDALPSDFCKVVERQLQEAGQYQDLPFEKLVRELKIDADLSRAPFFDTFFRYSKEEGAVQLTDLSYEVRECNRGWGKYDLNLCVLEKDSVAQVVLTYNGLLFESSTVKRLLDHYLNLIHQFLQKPEKSIRNLSVLAEDEKIKVLVDFNTTHCRYPQDVTIPVLIDRACRRFAGNGALRFGAKVWSYSELNIAVDALAFSLKTDYHVKPKEVVGLMLHRSDKMIISILAILKAGAAYLPIEPSVPEERARFMLDDCKCRTIVSDKDGEVNLYSRQSYDQVSLNSVLAKSVLPEEISVADIVPDDVAYIIYTSGTTGIPKGCAVSHRNVVRLLVNDNFPYDFTPSDVWVMAHSYSFDVSVWEIFGALFNGAQLCIPDQDTVRDADRMVNFVEDNKVTILNQTPRAFYGFAEMEKQRPTAALQRHLRYVFFAGDRLEAKYLRDWCARYPAEKVRLVNMYGITETTVHVTFHHLTSREILESSRPLSIGKPLPETQVYILDEEQRPLPIGVYGEIYVGGSGVSKGYFNNDALTKSKFVSARFMPGILYKSGDYARWMHDGTLDYLGRIDNQIKVRGFRVELGEIENALLKHPDVMEAAVLALTDDIDRHQLSAYYRGRQQIMVDELKAFLRKSLPDYMIPSFFTQIDRFPLNSNGKIDKSALPNAKDRTLGDANHKPGKSETDFGLIEIWKEVLGRDSVGINQNFFHIGGSSLKVIKLVNRINQKFGDTVKVSDLYNFGTIEELATLIHQENEIVAKREIEEYEL